MVANVYRAHKAYWSRWSDRSREAFNYYSGLYSKEPIEWLTEEDIAREIAYVAAREIENTEKLLSK